jgi:hypothetical protein
MDLTGKVFGRLTVIVKSSEKRGLNALWVCVCSCGKQTLVTTSNLNSGNSASCGCFRKEKVSEACRTHGMRDSSEYSIWTGMIQRCQNEKATSYSTYGGRGISVCDRWMISFENFYADMGPRPSPNHTLDRYPDMNGNYEPNNCRWATIEEQSSNRRDNVFYDYDGERLTVSQIARKVGLDPQVLNWRLSNGWDMRKATTTPINQRFE